MSVGATRSAIAQFTWSLTDVLPIWQELLDALADPPHPDHHELRRRVGLAQGAEFDPARFDPADANQRIATVILAGRPGR